MTGGASLPACQCRRATPGGCNQCAVGYVATGGNVPAAAAPVITSFNISRTGNVIFLSGNVQDTTGQPVEVWFSGTPSTNTNCYTDGNGNFSVTIWVSNGESGTVIAEALNCNFMSSPAASAGF